MAHFVDGYGLKFTGRKTWKAERRLGDHVVDEVPVTWTKGTRRRGSSVFQEVWYQHREEMDAALNSPHPFVVALATAEDYSKEPHKFGGFKGLFEVVPTGKILGADSIETRVVSRLWAAEADDASWA